MTYVSPVASAARVIPHVYVVECEDVVAYQADLAKMQAVTAAFITTQDDLEGRFWLFNEFGFECGMDPWTLCEGVDPRVDGSRVDIWTYTGACKSDLDPETRVFVKKETLRALGIELPEPAPGSREGYELHRQRAKAEARRFRHRIDDVPPLRTDVVIKLNGSDVEIKATTRAAAIPAQCMGGQVEYVTADEVYSADQMEYWRYDV